MQVAIVSCVIETGSSSGNTNCRSINTKRPRSRNHDRYDNLGRFGSLRLQVHLRAEVQRRKVLLQVGRSEHERAVSVQGLGFEVQ